MSAPVGYARVSTRGQDFTVQREALAALGVPHDRIYIDHGMTGTQRDRPGLREALAAVRSGETLLVSKLDRLARSVPDARDIMMELTDRGVRLQIGAAVYDPNDPVGRLLSNILAMVAEFETELIRARTREGLLVAKSKGRLKGKRPKLSPAQESHAIALLEHDQHTAAQIAELFGVARSTIYRARERAVRAHTAASSDSVARAKDGGARTEDSRQDASGGATPVSSPPIHESAGQPE